MLNRIADKKAECNFHFIMEAIKQESLKKAYKQRLRDQKEEEAKNQSGQANSAAGTSPAKAGNQAANAQNAAVNMEQFNITEDYLVTYREFMSALRNGLKNSLYKTLLPRTLSFTDVLDSKPQEKTYEVSDTNLDDFYMFRYELNSVFQ